MKDVDILDSIEIIMRQYKNQFINRAELPVLILNLLSQRESKYIYESARPTAGERASNKGE
jgi:hypothetical protein